MFNNFIVSAIILGFMAGGYLVMMVGQLPSGELVVNTGRLKSDQQRKVDQKIGKSTKRNIEPVAQGNGQRMFIKIIASSNCHAQ